MSFENLFFKILPREIPIVRTYLAQFPSKNRHTYAVSHLNIRLYVWDVFGAAVLWVCFKLPSCLFGNTMYQGTVRYALKSKLCLFYLSEWLLPVNW